MEIPNSNFFEVTINSKKLFEFIKDLQSQLLLLRQEIKALNGKFTLQLSSKEKMQNKHDDLVRNVEKIQKRSEEDYNNIKTYLLDFDKKNCQKFNDFSECTSMLSNKLTSVKNEMQEDFASKISYLQNKFQNSNALEKVEESFKQQFTVMKNYVQKANSVHQKAQQKLAEQIKLNEEKNILILKKLQTTEHIQQGIKTINHIQVSTEQMPDYSLSISKSKKKIKFDHACSIKSINPDSGNVGIKPKQALRMVINKLDHYTSEFDKKIPQLQQKIKKNLIKSEIVEEQIDIFNRKLQRQKAQIGLMIEQIKRLQQKKVNERIIDGLRVTIGQLSKQLDENINNTLTRQMFQKQSLRVNKQLLQLSEICADKAQKSDVKKGLTFLQTKIKDIVIVLAEQRNFISDGAIKRIPIKCLSCDKDLQYNNNDSSSMQRNLRCSINIPFRNSTPHLKRRAKMQAYPAEDN